MKTRTAFDLAELKALLGAFFRERPEVDAVYVFGSAAAGTAGPLSDLDIAVLLDRIGLAQAAADPGYSASLVADLMERLGTERVDLVLLHEASPLLAHRVIRDGRALYIRDEQALYAFQFRAIQRYLDTKRLRESQAEALAARLHAGGFGRSS
jgi:predicted nucleotidyltransferase